MRRARFYELGFCLALANRALTARFASRAWTAFLALSDRWAAVSFFALALPPSAPVARKNLSACSDSLGRFFIVVPTILCVSRLSRRKRTDREKDGLELPA